MNNFNFENSAIIRPPNKEPLDAQKKETRFVADSRLRNRSIYPEPNCYQLSLADDIEEVTSVEMVAADVQLVAFLIGRYNNTFTINDTLVTVEPGDYDAQAVVTAVQQALDVMNLGVSVTLISHRQKIKLSSNSAISIPKQEHSQVLSILGFNQFISHESEEEEEGGQHVLIADYKLNLIQDNKYAVLHLDQIHLNTSTNPVLHHSFAVFSPLTFQSHNMKVIKHLNPPIARMTKLKLRFTDQFGHPYDFQNHDNRLEFIFTSRKHLSRFSL